MIGSRPGADIMSLRNEEDLGRSEAGFDPELLLVLAKAGDTAALGRLLERYRHYMGLLVRIQIGRRLSRKVDAEDLLQEVGLEVHRKIAMFRGRTEREFLTWVRRMIGSIMANQLRHFLGTKCRDVRLERALVDELDHSSQAMNASLVAPAEHSEPASRPPGASGPVSGCPARTPRELPRSDHPPPPRGSELP